MSYIPLLIFNVLFIFIKFTFDVLNIIKSFKSNDFLSQIGCILIDYAIGYASTLFMSLSFHKSVWICSKTTFDLERN